jgi:hypothetical protein
MSSEPTSKKLLWDFFGPHALRTATHFQTHLQEFLSRHNLANVATHVESAGQGHQAVSCSVDAEVAQTLQAALRPNRVLDV